MTAIEPLDTVVRLVVAAALGGLIGFERELHDRPAGLRTHMLVCLGSCLLMITSVEVFFMYRHMTEPDPGRIAAQVVSGIGFLGAGTIMREGVTVRGLTTAASLWVVAALGLAVGTGLYFAAAVAAVLGLATLSYLPRLERSFFSDRSRRRFTLLVEDCPGMIGKVGSVLGQHGIDIKGIELKPTGEDDTVTLGLSVIVPKGVSFGAVAEALMNLDGVRSYIAD